MPPDTTPSPPTRPSVGDQLKTVAASPLTPVIALVTALTGMIGAGWQAYEGTQTTARVSYEALKAASEANTQAIEAIRQSQLETRTWVEELAAAAARRQATTEKAVARKVTKASAPPVVAAPPEVVPKAPPAPPPPVPTRLLPFDALRSP
jgi:hypothetical protein